MMISTTTQTRKKNKIKLWTIAFWLLLWQFASMALDKQILLASPLSVGRCLLSLVRTFSFWESIWFSLGRIALGFFCAVAGGVLLSALAYHVKLIRDILALPVAVLKATPVASFIVLVLIWMPSRNLSILISFIMAFPIIYTNLLEGFEHLDRKLFLEKVAKANNFEKAFGGWFKESTECIVILCLQKSNFGDYYELNIKIFIQGMFGNKYTRSKDLVKKNVGDVFTRQPSDYSNVLDFDISMDDGKRIEKLESLFREFVVPFTDMALSRLGLRELAKEGKIFLLPAVKEGLTILS